MLSNKKYLISESNRILPPAATTSAVTATSSQRRMGETVLATGAGSARRMKEIEIVGRSRSSSSSSFSNSSETTTVSSEAEMRTAITADDFYPNIQTSLLPLEIESKYLALTR